MRKVTQKRCPGDKKTGIDSGAVKVAGKPTLFKDDYADLAYKFCLLGATDAKMSEQFEVNEQTINRWKTKYPEFFQSIT